MSGRVFNRLSLVCAVTLVSAAFVWTSFTPSVAHADRKPLKIIAVKGHIRTLSADAEGLIAYSVRGGDKVHQLYVLDITGASAKPKNVSVGIGPDFAPDGSELVFYNDNKGDNLFWVTTITPKGESVFDMGVQGKDPTSAVPMFAPDGQSIIYSSSEGTFIIPRVGEVTRRITTTVLSDASWSPDGKSVLYARKGGGISTLDVVKGVSRDLTANFHGFNPRWSPDGSQILYTHELKVYVMDLATGKRKAVADADRAEWTNSGKGLVIMRATGKFTGSGPEARSDMEVHWIALEGDVSGDGENDELLIKRAHEVAVAPDGRTVILAASNDGIYKVRLDKLEGEQEAASRVKQVRQSARVPVEALPKAEQAAPAP